VVRIPILSYSYFGSEHRVLWLNIFVRFLVHPVFDWIWFYSASFLRLLRTLFGPGCESNHLLDFVHSSQCLARSRSSVGIQPVLFF
jgi:hypothetical protein